jgi:hypothetical protein
MRRSLFAVLMVMFMAASLGAQRRPRVYTTNDAGVWASAAVSGFRANEVNDGATGSKWDFGNATNAQYRVSLEKGLSSMSSFGIAGSYANVPFVYSADLAVPLPGGASGARCSNATVGCNAHLNLMTLVGTFHYGSGVGLHQVLELNGGIVSYQNLKRDSDGAKLAGSGNIDPLLLVGWGFGYGLNDRTNIDIVSDYSFALHERTGLSNSTGNTNSMPGLRASLRMGFGSRTVRR